VEVGLVAVVGTGVGELEGAGGGGVHVVRDGRLAVCDVAVVDVFAQLVLEGLGFAYLHHLMRFC
jgi:hypothetical protein